MRTLKALSTAGTLGLLVAGSLVFGSAPAATAAICEPSPSNSFPGTAVLDTSFESGGYCGLVPKVGGTGTIAISTAQKQTGTKSAKMHVTDSSGSLANLSMPFTTTTKTAYADGWFNITAAGITGSNVPYFRFFSGSTRIADVYRYNNNGQLWLRVTSPSGTFVYTKLTARKRLHERLAPHRHARHDVRLQVNDPGVVGHFAEIRQHAVNINATTLSKVQMGAEHTRQKGDEYIDDVSSSASATFPKDGGSGHYPAAILCQRSAALSGLGGCHERPDLRQVLHSPACSTPEDTSTPQAPACAAASATLAGSSPPASSQFRPASPLARTEE